jgi:hypothetical protein
MGGFSASSVRKCRCSNGNFCRISRAIGRFFEIRVAGLKQRLELGSRISPAPMVPGRHRTAQAIHARTRRLVDAQYAA